MGNFFAELKRRHIYRVAAAYAVVVWVALQIFNNLEPILKLPDWAGTLVLVLLLVGFPVALIFAWTLELKTPSAAQRTETGKVDWILTGALALVIGLIGYEQLSRSSGSTTPLPQIAVPAQPAPAGGISIAVLPFANVSGDASQEFFSDGMTDEIITALTKVSALRVVGRESVFQFKGQKPDMKSVSQALGAAYLIEGSVRKAGDRVRIAAQLTRADTGVNLWAESYDRQLTDIFATQSDIAQAIAGALRVPLGLQQGESLTPDRTGNLQSYDQYLRAKALARTRGLKSYEDAAAILESLVARDPSYAPAWAQLARNYSLLPGGHAELRNGPVDAARRIVQTYFDKADRAAREAIRLDPRNAVAYAVQARLRARGAGKWVESEDLFKQALALGPDEPEVLGAYAQTLYETGHIKDALAIAERVRMQEPLVPGYAETAAIYMQMAGQNAASIPILEAIPANAVGGAARNYTLAQAYAAEGRYQQAADTLLLITGDLFPRDTVEEAAKLLRTAPTAVKDPASLPVFGHGLHFVYAYVGAMSRVMEPGELAFEFGFNVGGDALWDKVFAPLRQTERFKALMRKTGLVAYWRERGWPDLCRPMGADDFVCE